MDKARLQQMDDARRTGDKAKKPYLLPRDAIKDLVRGMGGCFATDRIVIEGAPVGYMYRDEPDFDEDSGWRFLAGDETDDYLNDQWNTAIYRVNTICNYDSEIIPLLDSPTGFAFARSSVSGKLEQVEAPLPRE